MKPYVVGITGASGAIYGIRFVQVLAELGYDMALIISEAARLVIQEELQVSLRSLTDKEAFEPFFESKHLDHISFYSNRDLTAPVASGSYPTQGMVIIPCSAGTLGHIASGASTNLIHRATECTLKEGRRLIVVPRETPFSVIQLENLLKLARIGVRVLPASPGFYSGSQTIQDLVDFLIGKVLDSLEIPHAIYPRWVGKS
ncbi:MAG: UbiX family flavin prenyltransferase [Candidatus Omnitrophica bacterium]|nr:UbiX family flavin prenyltransferase [Candidatus Omnitrophota bacterium]